MKNSGTILLFTSLALAAALPTTTADATTTFATRTFVSPTGSDSNPCTLALPCPAGICRMRSP